MDIDDQRTFFIRHKIEGTELIIQDTNGLSETIALQSGTPQITGDLSWLILEGELASASPRNDRQDSGLYSLLHWLEQPMHGQDLANCLGEYLNSLVEKVEAAGGLLVRFEQGHAQLVSCTGLKPEQADALWNKIPENFCLDILRHQAKIILPEALSKAPSDVSTVYVRHVKSYVGFPIFAEGHLAGILFFYFHNLVRSFTEECQTLLEGAANILGLVIQRAILRQELAGLRLAVGETNGVGEERLMIGNSEHLSEVYRLIQRLAPVPVPVLIQGETGTGKELVAKELHRRSGRRQKPFITLNAAALPENLIEAELFGFKRGAFTGAIADRKGLIEQADTGTLFIDEIGELPLAIQAKLLRVLQEKSVQRLGDTLAREVDFRLVTATHRDLREMINSGEFREDLFYRLLGAEVSLHPLRQRPEDIAPLAQFFKQRFSERHSLHPKEFTSAALSILASYDWPGNVRELENTIGRAYVLADSAICPEHLNLPMTSDPSEQEEETFAQAKEAWIKNYLVRALEQHKGRRAETARSLGIGQRTLFRYLEQYGIKES